MDSTIMSQNENSETEQLDDWYYVVSEEEKSCGDNESDEKVSDKEDWYYVVANKEKEKEKEEEEEEENSFLDGESDDSEIGFPSMDCDGFFDKTIHNITPSIPLPRQQQKLKDVVKNYVLPCLPAKTLVRFRSVSTDWDQWIRNPFLAHQQSYYFKQISGFFCQISDTHPPTFITLNPNAYGIPNPSLTFLPEPCNILSSSNGLLLCQGRNGHNTYYICNPAIQKWKKIPDPNLYHGSDPAIILAFEPSVLNMGAEYRLICAVPLLDQPIVCFEIYSSRTNSWRQSDTICFELEESSLANPNASFYIKGTAYWETSTGKVLAFNLDNDVYEILSLPIDVRGGVLTQMRDELCCLCISCDVNEYFVEVYGGMDLSMKQQVKVPFEIGYDGKCKVLPCLDGNVVRILDAAGGIHSYSLSERKVEVMMSRADASDQARYFPYLNSLVQLE